MNLRKFLIQDVGRFIPDKLWIQIKYFQWFGKLPNLKNPKTFNEKLNWLKLYDRWPEYTRMVDKYEAKQYVAERIGAEYVIPTIGGPWNSFDEIDFDALPDQFVLKTTHDCGGVVICKDKNTFNIENARKFLTKHLENNYYRTTREWPYKDVRPRIIAEEFMQDCKTAELRDYKFFCFDGEVKAMFVATERQKENEEVKFDFFDADFEHLSLRQGHPNATVCPEKPVCFDEMRLLAGKLSQNIPQVRVDFYEVDGRVYLGELTLSHFAGLVPFDPPEWDRIFGEWVSLPNSKTEL